MNRFVRAWAVVLGVLGALAAIGAPGCSSSSSPALVSEGCSLNSDCDTGLVCIFGLCHVACRKSSDCQVPEICVSSGATTACELPTETSCTAGASSCPTGLECTSGGQCRNPCNGTTGCAIEGDQCTGGFCFGSGELESSCTAGSSSTCLAGLTCASDKQCRYACSTTACPAGNRCKAGYCYPSTEGVDAAGKDVSVKDTSTKDLTVNDTSDSAEEETSAEDTSAKDAPVRDTSSKDMSVNDTFEREAPAEAGEDTSSRDAPGDAGEDTSSRDAPADAGEDMGVRDTSTRDMTVNDTANDTNAGDARADGPRDGGSVADTSNPCTIAQTQFGNTGQGDTNAYFKSGVGARTADELLIFSGYVGPEVSDASTVNSIYVQGFDPVSAAPKGSAAWLFNPPNLITPDHTLSRTVVLYSAAVAPTGQIALVYYAEFDQANSTLGPYDDKALYAAFFDSGIDAGTASDAGAAGLQLQKVVLLETAPFGGQPYVFWSPASEVFVISWEYAGWFVAVNKFLVDGRAASGDTDPVPTNDPSGYVYGSTNYVTIPGGSSGSSGVSGSLFGVGYIGDGYNSTHYNPYLTVLDPVGNPIGGTVQVVPPSPSIGGAWVAVAGTANGFVYLYDNTSPNSVAEVFLATSGDAGLVDGGIAGEGGLPTFTFTGAVRANAARAVSDGVGGAGGVGVALQYPTKVSFAYVNADGVGHQGPTSVFAHTYETGDIVSLTNLAGSFVISLYNASTQSTQIAASGCPSN
jgi:hypothetical protein